MRKVTECQNERCNGELSEGHRDTCPHCGSYDVEKAMIPENADDIKVLRADYNRRHMHDPGFVPSVEYIQDPNNPRKTIPKPVES